MVFKANNTGAYISIDGKQTQIENLTGQKTPSEGIVIIRQEKAIYIPNAIEDLKTIIDKIDELAGFVLSVNTAIPSMSPDPTVALQIPIFKSSLSSIKGALK